MIRQKDLEKHKFFTTNGRDMWRVTKVATVIEVTLVNYETEKTEACRLGEATAEKFHAVTMPHLAAHFAVKPKTKAKTKAAAKRYKGAKNKYLGVSERPKKGGGLRYYAASTKGGKWTNLGAHDSELIAAAAVQEHLGNKAEATRLRVLAKNKNANEPKAANSAGPDVDERTIFGQGASE